MLRHTYTSDGFTGPSDLTQPKIIEYVSRQDIVNKVGRTPPPLWLNFIADGGRRCRFLGAHENRGELAAKRTEHIRYFDLRESDALRALQGRLLIEWSRDAVNWAKRADRSTLPVVEIADPQVVAFPGYDQVLVAFDELTQVVSDSRYAPWRHALAAVQGVYLIADQSTGQLYVGKADGGERILGRWTSYAKDGHGGNVALRELGVANTEARRHLVFSILRVFGPSVPSAEVDAAEAHYKRALLSRTFGLNRN